MSEEEYPENGEQQPNFTETPQSDEQEPAPATTADAFSATEYDASDKPESRSEFAARYEQAKQREIAKLQEQIEAQNKSKKQKRKFWIKTSLLLVLIIASVFIMFTITHYVSDGKTKKFSEMLLGINWGLFALLVAALLLHMIVESAKYAYLLKISTGKFRFRNSIKAMFLGRYYDGITPFSSGGQPFQIYYLHKKDIPAGAATAVPLTRFIVSTIIWGLFALVLMAVSSFVLRETGNAVTETTRIIAWISIVLNLLFPIGVVMISFFPKAGKKAIVWLVNLLSKFRIVKRKYAVSKKYVYEVQEYCNSIKVLFSKWWKLLPLILLCIVESAINVSLPFFVVISVADIAPTYDLLMQIVVLNCISQYSAYLIPTPGNTGAMEMTTSLVFVTVTGIAPVIGWVVLVWRLVTYYVYIVSGIGINIFEIIRDAVRNKRAARKLKTK